MKVQDYLRSGKTLEDLTADYAIKANRHKTFPNLVLLKYNQIDSPMGEAIPQECRGLILDESDNWNVVSRSFDKFFNEGEGHAAPIDWSTAAVQEKCDGSLITLYEYKGTVQVATTGSPDASGDVQGFGFTFAELFWKTLASYGRNADDMLQILGGDNCIMFELTTPYNRVVVQHAEPSLTILAIRKRTTGEYLPRYMVWGVSELFGLPLVKQFDLATLDGIKASFDTLDPLQQEGYVVLDAANNRIKVKHPGYIALHHAKDGMGPKYFVDIVRNGESSEVLSAFPEFGDKFTEIQTAYDALMVSITEAYDKHKDAVTQKDFALLVKDLPFSGALFMLRNGKAENAKAWFAGIPLNSAAKMLGVFDSEPVGNTAE